MNTNENSAKDILIGQRARRINGRAERGNQSDANGDTIRYQAEK